MAKVIAIDRNERRLRYVLAETGARGQVNVQAASAIDLPADAENATAELGRHLQNALTELKAVRARVLVGLGRGGLDAVEVKVPAAEDSELPMLVRNLAMRDLSSISEETPLDFLAGPARSDGARDVIAMAVRDDVRQELDQLATAASVSPTRVLVRPYELQTFLSDPQLKSQVVLMVCCSSQVADVLMRHPDGWQLARSIRLTDTSAPSVTARHVVNEIRRSLFTLPVEDFGPTHIDRILLLAGRDELQPLATELGTALDAPVQRLNPFTDGRVRMDSPPAEASQFAPLLGMLLNESAASHPVDFLNPRRPPKKAGRRNQMIAAAAVAAAVIGSAYYYVHGQLAELDREITGLVERRNELKDLTEKVQPKLRLASAVDSWENSRISWLDELRDLTVRMPPSRDLKVQRFSASPSRNGSATVTFSGESRAPSVITQMEQSLRDEHHAPRTPGVRERPLEDRSIWTFQTTMTVKPRSPEEYVPDRAEDEKSPTVATAEPASEADSDSKTP